MNLTTQDESTESGLQIRVQISRRRPMSSGVGNYLSNILQANERTQPERLEVEILLKCVSKFIWHLLQNFFLHLTALPPCLLPLPLALHVNECLTEAFHSRTSWAQTCSCPIRYLGVNPSCNERTPICLDGREYRTIGFLLAFAMPLLLMRCVIELQAGKWPSSASVLMTSDNASLWLRARHCKGLNIFRGPPLALL